MHVKSFCRSSRSHSAVAAVPEIIACCVLCCALQLLPLPVPAETLSTATIGTFPRDMSIFARTDLKAARKFAWFEPLRNALLPRNFQLFNQFVTSVGLDPNSQVDALYWGVVVLPERGEQVVGVAVGQFDPSAIADRFQDQKLPSFDLDGFKLYAFGTGQGPGDIFFTLLDSDTAAFGQRAALEKLVDVRTGGSERFFVNETLFPLIGQANSDAILWAVLDHKNALQAMREFVLPAMQFPQTAAIVDRLKALTISVDTKSDDEIDLDFQVVCSSVDDANTFAAALQVGLMSRRYLASGDDPAITVILDRARVTPRGDRLNLEFSLTQEQFQSFVLSNARPARNF